MATEQRAGRMNSGLRKGRASWEFAQKIAAYVPDVLNADFARVETVGRKVAEKGKEVNSLANLRVGVLSVGKKFKRYLLLLPRTVKERITRVLVAIVIQPGKAPGQPDLEVPVFAGEQVDELRGICLKGSS